MEVVEGNRVLEHILMRNKVLDGDNYVLHVQVCQHKGCLEYACMLLPAAPRKCIGPALKEEPGLGAAYVAVLVSVNKLPCCSDAVGSCKEKTTCCMSRCVCVLYS